MTQVDQIADSIYRISTCMPDLAPGGFTFNQADLNPQRLAIMHGSSYDGDCPALLRQMADVYEQKFGCGSG